MVKETVQVLVDGGEAKPGPAIGGVLGPLGVNIGAILSEINQKTSDFKGMKVPVKIVVDTDTKAFTISVGMPPTSELIKKEVGIKKGSGSPNTEFVADLSREQLEKVARMKMDASYATEIKSSMKEVLGVCRSMGVTIEGKKPQEFLQEV
ncbi:MAG: 50S ribosomal protein L11 [Nanoarchaeota archaeon]|nr:50S ribosomal protein L11 [Nanoarchaeota archaeon]